MDITITKKNEDMNNDQMQQSKASSFILRESAVEILGC
jgi:hypothetical protein